MLKFLKAFITKLIYEKCNAFHCCVAFKVLWFKECMYDNKKAKYIITRIWSIRVYTIIILPCVLFLCCNMFNKTSKNLKMVRKYDGEEGSLGWIIFSGPRSDDIYFRYILITSLFPDVCAFDNIIIIMF